MVVVDEGEEEEEEEEAEHEGVYEGAETMRGSLEIILEYFSIGSEDRKRKKDYLLSDFDEPRERELTRTHVRSRT